MSLPEGNDGEPDIVAEQLNIGVLAVDSSESILSPCTELFGLKEAKLKPELYDKLLLSERTQISRFKGLRTWEAQLFSLVDVYQPPREDASWFEDWVPSRQIKVNENQHLKIFAKDRWLDNIPQTGTKNLPTVIKGKPIADKQLWSVDCEPFWDELKVCVELADRILKHSFKGSWFQTMASKTLKVKQCSRDGVTYRGHHDSVPLERDESISYHPSRHPQPPRLANAIRIINPATGEEVLPHNPVPVSPDPFAYDSSNSEYADSESESSLSTFDGDARTERTDSQGPNLDQAAEDAREEKEQQDLQRRQQRQHNLHELPREPLSPQDGYFVKRDWIDDEAQCYKLLDEVRDKVHWVFFDSDSDMRMDSRRDRAFSSTSVTLPNLGTVLIALDIECIRPLLIDKNSPMERLLAIQTTAIVMIRGIIEAIATIQKWDHGLTDLTFADEGIVDLGSSFEDAVFGGKINLPFHIDPAKGPRTGNVPMLSGSDFATSGDPILDRLPYLDEDVLYRYHKDERSSGNPFRTRWLSYPIPGFWSLNMLQESFWGHEVKRFSSGALHFPKNFRAREHRDHHESGSSHFETRTYSAEYRGRSNDELTTLNKILTARRQKWAELRFWESDAYHKWQTTPYSMANTRWHLKDVNNWFKERSPWAEFRIQQLVDQWLEKDPSFDGTPQVWFYSAVAEMVAASLPGRDEEAEFPSEEFPHGIHSLSGLRPSKSADENFVANIVDALRSAHRNKGVSSLHKRHNDNDRQKHLTRAWNKSDFYFYARPHSTGLKIGFRAALRYLQESMMKSDMEKEWLPFQFDLPPYFNWGHPGTRRDSLASKGTAVAKHFVNIGQTELRPTILAQFAASVADADDCAVEETPEDQLQSEYGAYVDQAPQGSTHSLMMARGDVSEPLYKYYTTGEIADHASLEDMWLIVEDEEELALFDVSQACVMQRIAMEDLGRMTERLEYGFHIKGRLEDHFREELTMKVGYVLQWKHEADVAENDGRNGRPLWIYLGLDVFDITNFTYYIEDEKLEEALRSCPGGNPTAAIFSIEELRNSISVIVERLMPWRCGRLRQAVSPSGCELRFTEAEVRRHEFPGTGMYTVIGGSVYDVTDFTAFHPGGTNIMAKYAGTDCTQAFQKYHKDAWQSILREHEYLRIGHVVPERLPDVPLAKHEIEVQGYIYAILAWNGEHDSDLDDRQRELQKQLGGKVLDGETLDAGVWTGLFGEPKKVPLRRIWTWKNVNKDLTRAGYCVAKREPSPESLPVITPAELATCNGYGYEGRHTEKWVAVGQDVYDLTSLLQHGSHDIRRALRKYVGGEITHSDLAKYVVDRYAHRIVAKLSGPVPRLTLKRQRAEDAALPEVFHRRFKRGTQVLQDDALRPGDYRRDVVNWPSRSQPARKILRSRQPTPGHDIDLPAGYVAGLGPADAAAHGTTQQRITQELQRRQAQVRRLGVEPSPDIHELMGHLRRHQHRLAPSPQPDLQAVLGRELRAEEEMARLRREMRRGNSAAPRGTGTGDR